MICFLERIRTSVIERVQEINIEEREPMPVEEFCSIFCRSNITTVIAEIKLSSPSRGLIYTGSLSPVEIAISYTNQGAKALSILTEPYFFNGDVQIIRDIRALLPNVQILLKDFILSPIQIKQAYHAGANAVLLIVGFLDPVLLKELYDYACSLGLTPLVEVHDEKELEQALLLNPKIIGINHRNLKTLTIDLSLSEKLIPSIPDNIFVVCESGITTSEDINRMRNLNCDGFLIGSHFMQSHDPGQALCDLLRGASHAH